MPDDVVRAIEQSVQGLLARQQRLVLAVSGGADSAVLLDAVTRLRTRAHQIVVATVDHGTGEAATEAAARTIAAAARAGLPAISERLALARRDEATLREARWRFLRQVATTQGATVVTAHSLDDHIETVVMRIIRGSSARGIAGLLAESAVERPLLEHRASAIREYARTRRIEFADDPSNVSLAYFRNRVRLVLLPAIRRLSPGFEEELLSLSRRAARLRQEVDVVARQFVLEPSGDQRVTLDAESLQKFPDESLWLLLPSLVARCGLTLDRRGLARLSSVIAASAGARGQLSGGFEAVRGRHEVTVLRPPLNNQTVLPLRGKGDTIFGSFRFRAEPAASIVHEPPDAWRIHISRSAELVVRQWYPGDRLTTDLKGSRRKVKRFFSDAGIVGPLREGWPVVLCGEDVIWIPGIKASDAAIPRDGKTVHYSCERIGD